MALHYYQQLGCQPSLGQPFKSQKVKSLRVCQQGSPAAQPAKPPCEKPLHVDPGLADSMAAPPPKAAAQTKTRNQEAPRGHQRLPPGCAFPHFWSWGHSLGPKKRLATPKSRATPTNGCHKFHLHDHSIFLRCPRKIRPRTVGFVFYLSTRMKTLGSAL